MSAITDAVDRIATEVEEQKTVNASAIALITDLAGQIRENATQPARLIELANTLDAQAADLANAVTTNTPTPPEPTPEPAPEA